MTEPRLTRPLLRYLGGKWRLAPWIISHFPPHRVYVEPFGGAANVLLRKPRAQTEVYNDLDDDVVNLFRVLRDPVQAHALVHLLRLTPFARAEFFAAYEPGQDPVECARRLIVRSFMGFGSCASRSDRTTGFRRGARAGEAPASKEWSTHPDALQLIIDRLAGVAIESQPASRLIADRDGPDVLFYVDPPYVHATRSPKRTRTAPSNGYRHELSDIDHVALLDQLRSVRGGGGAVWVRNPDLCAGPARLASGREARDGGRRPGTHRSSMDQWRGLGRARSIWPAARPADARRASKGGR